MSDLDGIRLKIARASQHIAELQEMLDEWRRSAPYSLVVEIDQTTDIQSYRIGSEPVPPPDLPVIGDALYNLRSALDHLAWQLVLKAGGTPGRHTEFPIFDDADKFQETRAQSKMAGMDQLMKDRIKSHQPCFGGNQNRNRALWGLHEYGNIDKHRTLLVVPVSTQDMLWQPGGDPVYKHKGPVQKDTVLAQFPPDQKQSYFSARPSIAFSEPPSAGEDVQYMLGFIRVVVASIVDEFEREFFE